MDIEADQLGIITMKAMKRSFQSIQVRVMISVLFIPGVTIYRQIFFL